MKAGTIERQLEQAKEGLEKLKAEIDKAPLRIEPAMIITPAETVHWAACIEAAPDDRRWFWANLFDSKGILTGTSIQVYCTVIGLSNVMLDACVPRLSNDPLGARPIPIVQRPYYYEEEKVTETRWWCEWWFNKGVECVCKRG